MKTSGQTTRERERRLVRAGYQATKPLKPLGVCDRAALPMTFPELNWLQRHRIAAALYKSDWKLAVSLAPEEQRPALQKLCDERSLGELAILFDPATEGVLVDPEDAHIPLHGLTPRSV